ncbi:MAG: PD-(D/E)XK nuclease family protein, partial [Firmicutes bacterium]|nr:PD-(D/E)XK nuclease family protein [Bacillota bacterium]
AAAREKMEPADDDWLAEQLGEFRAMLASDAIQQQLRRNGATELWREQDFVVVHEQRTLSGTMDRVAIHRNAEGNVQSAVVIDFKTDGVNETTMDETIARYAPQMRTYRAALTSMLSLPPDRIAVRLLFVGQGMAVQVQSDETWTLIETESA